jgi:head-tail adaptor
MDLLLGGAPAAKFPTIGTKVVGKVLSQRKQQSKDMATGELKTWEDGAPIWEIVFTLQTDERDPDIEDDDGTRRIFARGQMLKAIGAALRQANWKRELVGGTLGVKYTSDGEARTRGFSPPKIYSAVFEPPDPADALDEMAGPADEYGEEPVLAMRTVDEWSEIAESAYDDFKEARRVFANAKADYEHKRLTVKASERRAVSGRSRQ